MKTIQELNSKWYWRLIKVVWIITLILISGAIIIGSGSYFYESNREYNPYNLDKVSDKIEGYNSTLSEVTEINRKYLGIKAIGPKLVENIGVKDEEGNIFRAYDIITRDKLAENKKELIKIVGTGEILNSIYILRSLGYNLEGVNFSDSENTKKTIYPEDATFDQYTDGLEITINDIYQSFNEAEISEGLKEISDFIIEVERNFKEIKNGERYRFYIPDFADDSDELNNLLGNRDYISMTGWIKIIFYELGIIIITLTGVFLVNYLLRGILYYIILGKFNPEK